MVKITFIQNNGTVQTVHAAPGMTVMESAGENMVPGSMPIAVAPAHVSTCHVFVLEPQWMETTGKRSEMEEDMLDFAFDVFATTAACLRSKRRMTDGLVLRVPEKQF